MAGAGLGHLVAGLTRPDASPVLAVGSVVVDSAPTPLKTWAIRTFGTQDKLVLVSSVALGALLLAALAGLLVRRSLAAGAVGLAALAALATGAALTRPTATAGSVLPGLVTALTGVLALVSLHRQFRATPRRRPDAPASTGATRRTVLGSGVLAAGIAALGLAAGAAGQRLTSAAQQVAGTLPLPRRRLPPLPAGLERSVPGVTPLRTPTARFYRVDTALTVPVVDPADWELVIDGDVERTVRLSYQDILDMPLVERDITLTCVSNEVGGPYAGGARWTGVPVRDLLALASPRPGNDQVLSTSVDGYTSSTPLAALTDEREALLAVGMNGQPLPRVNGYPARLVTPGLYGYVGATKWLTRLTVTTYRQRRAYWTVRGWATQGPIKPSARIDTPEPLVSIAPGRVAIAGTAWAQRQGVRGVQVQIDDGPWRPARLGPEVNIDYWRQWWFPWDATTGQHRLRARCVYGASQEQTATPAPPFPDGSSGLHEIVVVVS
ncbi:molybdopterin-dependent oxidoreductase [Barrientosiimonas endolithica]|uniref:molybdopterin-dependent oxidoreductase n=1 Tax=Barrientosiimonas endolithica TaxID=1535208 RepID=UPI00259AF815|nr:molybdopterin-dependent oxidoreductase [Barrientosiimonas endolithica]